MEGRQSKTAERIASQRVARNWSHQGGSNNKLRITRLQPRTLTRQLKNYFTKYQQVIIFIRVCTLNREGRVLEAFHRLLTDSMFICLNKS